MTKKAKTAAVHDADPLVSRRSAFAAVAGAATFFAVPAAAAGDLPGADGVLTGLVDRLRGLVEAEFMGSWAPESAAGSTGAVLAQIEAVQATSPAAILAKIEAAALFVEDDELDGLEGAADRVLWSAVLDLKRLKSGAVDPDRRGARL
ncbi:hypothetical protein DFR50_12513 [Roseiarcus fermentans]|uniref:Uncharacterized protein n=1 Tax=Roseiarcus fermentans TaxID=1473586 RepID=A0A366F1J2_9HYPH|nr:hypothetical protein [Roseiarcus fermentans]RBP08532.1 hypothetical protein DFR50_12513 [Roseiarcus fermentans]